MILDETSSSSSNASQPMITKTTSNKQKSMLVIDGYNFQLKGCNAKKNMRFWRCAHRSYGVLLHTTLVDEFIRYSGKTVDHSHLSNLAESEIRNLREKMRERAEKELLPLQEIAE